MELSSTNLASVTAQTVNLVYLLKIEFDVPVYAHSGVGVITFDGNDYLGVGHLGSISNTRQSELLGPTPLNYTLSGVDANLIAESLNAGNFGDVTTLYLGFRGDDGELSDVPVEINSGTYEFSTIRHGKENSITISVQQDLANIDEAHGGRYSDEDQLIRFLGDTGLSFVADTDKKLIWAGGPVRAPSGGGRDRGDRGGRGYRGRND